MFNGNYLENVIPGYRTLYVSGREIINTELTELEVGALDGARYRRKRYPSRTIVVGYQLIAEDNGAFRNAYNKLNALLDEEQATLIFADEPDKFFIGTKQGSSEVPTGKNAIASELEFYCADPFKYSVEGIYSQTNCGWRKNVRRVLQWHVQSISVLPGENEKRQWNDWIRE